MHTQSGIHNSENDLYLYTFEENNTDCLYLTKMRLKLSIKVAFVRRVLLVIVGRIETPWLYVINRPAQKREKNE